MEEQKEPKPEELEEEEGAAMCDTPTDLAEREERESWQHMRNQAMFADANEMKAKLRDQLTKPDYNVAMYYKESGWAQKVARNHIFEQFTLGVITVNALWISIDTDCNPEEVLSKSPVGFQVMEQLFCLYFVGEWLIRFLAFKNKCNGLRDAWFVFDTLLVVLFVLDTWIMYLIMSVHPDVSGGRFSDSSILRIARLLRLTRMARMARLLRAMPELLILIKGMGAAMRSVGFTLVLLVVLLYIFGVAFRQLCSDAEDRLCADFFSSVVRSMHTLLIHGTLMDDLRYFVRPLEEYSMAMLFLFYVFLLITALTVMNMLIGVLCDVVNTTAAIENESLAILYVKDRLQAIMDRTGILPCKLPHVACANDLRINKEEFLQILENREAATVLSDVGVDVVGLVDFADFIFKHDLTDDEDEVKVLSFADFVEVLLQLRGNNNATVRDMVDLRKFVQLKVATLDNKLDALAMQSGVKSGTRSSRWPRGTMRSMSSTMLPAGLPAADENGPVKAQSSPNFLPERGGTAQGSGPTSYSELASPGGRSSNDTNGDGVESPSLQRRQPCEKGDVEIDINFRQLVERLSLEHERTLANLQRSNERLKAEIDFLKLQSKPLPDTRNSAVSISDKSVTYEYCPESGGKDISTAGEQHVSNDVSVSRIGHTFEFNSAAKSLDGKGTSPRFSNSIANSSIKVASSKSNEACVKFNNLLEKTSSQARPVASDAVDEVVSMTQPSITTDFSTNDRRKPPPDSSSPVKPGMPPMLSATSSLSTIGSDPVSSASRPHTKKRAVPL